MARHKGGDVVKIVAAVIAILLLLAIVVGLVMYLKGVKNDQITGLYVQCGDKVFVPDGDNVFILPYEGEKRFDIYNAESVSLSIVPNTDFEFTVNGEIHRFNEVDILTEYFISRDDLYGNYFYFNCEKHDYTMMGILKAMYGDDVQIVFDSLTMVYIAKLIVQAEDGTEVSIILCPVGVPNVVLDTMNIAF